MGLAIAVLLLAILLGGLGFAVHVLWVLAVIMALVWVIGFFARGTSARWYGW